MHKDGPAGDDQDPRQRLRELLVAAEMQVLDVPHVVICLYSDQTISYVTGPFPDEFAALQGLVELEESPHRERGTQFCAVPLTPHP